MSQDKPNRNKNESFSSPNRQQFRDNDQSELWGVFLFGLIGASAATLAFGQIRRLRAIDWLFSQNSRKSFREEAWKRYNRRMQEEYEDEMARVERIRRMQSVFNRERNKTKKGYESWKEGGGTGPYNQHNVRDDWYWKSDPSFKHGRTNYRETPPRQNVGYSMSSHYSVLGLDRFRTKPYTEAEIKTAFRAKAMEFHPDQNPKNKEAAEAKFKEVMVSYEAIKKERTDSHL